MLPTAMLSSIFKAIASNQTQNQTHATRNHLGQTIDYNLHCYSPPTPMKHQTTTKAHPDTTCSSGFTLIEVLVVSGITVLLLLATTSLFVSFIIGNAKTNLRHRLKGVGDNAVERMEFLLRNASQVTSACTQTGSSSNSITFSKIDSTSATLDTVLPADENHYRLRLIEASGNSYLSPADIDVQQVADADPDTNLFTCFQNGPAQYVEINLTLTIGTPNDDPNEFNTSSYQQNFHGGVLLRNTGL
jgi:prepilin-type N-terminal cleavage/methylation domain-containing protein